MFCLVLVFIWMPFDRHHPLKHCWRPSTHHHSNSTTQRVLICLGRVADPLSLHGSPMDAHQIGTEGIWRPGTHLKLWGLAGCIGDGASGSTVASGGVLDTYESQRPRFPSRTLFSTSLVTPLMLWL